MRLTNLQCDGCGRIPTLWEWIRGEFTQEGYGEWRHPGIAFRDAGFPITADNQARCERLFLALFGRPMPLQLSYLCPECQERAVAELPDLALADAGPAAAPPEPADENRPRYYLGDPRGRA